LGSCAWLVGLAAVGQAPGRQGTLP